MEAYEKIKKTLAVAFMNDLDNNRPEGEMCLSNGECADIEKAFNEQDWPKLARYLDKYTESGDEWIRKSLINFLSSFELMRDDATFRKGDFDLDAIKGYISYLEKQKEQNHDGKKWIYEDEYKKDLDRLYNDGKDEVLNNPAKYGLQKEPKHASDDLQKSFEEGQKSIVDNPERYGLCKKAEWSEEDERILKGIIGRIDHDQNYGVSKAEMLSFLKSLRPSWKPSEGQKKR